MGRDTETHRRTHTQKEKKRKEKKSVEKFPTQQVGCRCKQYNTNTGANIISA